MLRVSVVLSVFYVVFAAQSLGPLQPKPEKFRLYGDPRALVRYDLRQGNVPGCYIENLDQVIPFGEAAPARSSCMEYRCGEEFITYNTCGSVHVEPPLELIEDKTKPYPGCCPTVKEF